MGSSKIIKLIKWNIKSLMIYVFLLIYSCFENRLRSWDEGWNCVALSLEGVLFFPHHFLTYGRLMLLIHFKPPLSKCGVCLTPMPVDKYSSTHMLTYLCHIVNRALNKPSLTNLDIELTFIYFVP